MPEPCPDDLRMRAVEKAPERCEGAAGGRVERDQMGSTIFRHGIGRSEPDGHASRASSVPLVLQFRSGISSPGFAFSASRPGPEA